MVALTQIPRAMANSLSARLLLIFAVATIAYGFAARYAYSLFTDFDYFRRIAGSHIVLHSEYVIKDLGSPPSIERAKEIAAELPIDIRITGPDVEWSSTPDFYSLEDIPFSTQSLVEMAEAQELEPEPWIERLQQVEFASYLDHAIVKLTHDDHQIVFVSPRISEMPARNWSTLLAAVIGGLILFACYLAVRWLFRPIAWMQEGAARIGSGELDYRIPTRRHDELAKLTHNINSMAEDVEGMLDAKQQLMLAISHELRSPVTRAKVAAEFIGDDKTRGGILEDLDEMERLIGDLLESEALNTRHAILHREPVDLGGLVQGVIQTDFSARQERISLEVMDDLPAAMLDATRLRLLTRNLIDNALRYNPEEGEPIEVRIDSDSGLLYLSVRDHGPGIPDEHLDYVTEPFYRADPARSRTTGGMGLGLYLCRRVAEVHGGKLAVHSGEGFGTRVSIILPLGDA